MRKLSEHLAAKSMKRLPSRQTVLARFIREEDGQAITEYILILAGTVTGASLLTRSLLTALDQGVKRLAGQLEQDLKTGRAPVNAWRN